MTRPDNVLTPRVQVNRIWTWVFGEGLVTTVDNFGLLGTEPSDPDLLDHLATRFVRSGWNVKVLMRAIVTSRTYRQSSAADTAAYVADPENRLLGRGARFRMDAEMIRDQAMSVSGLLSNKMYGVPVKPYQPSFGVKAAFGPGMDWKTSAGEDKYRRGIYTHWRRTNPYPSMAAFDAPNRNVCTVRRVPTNTPLQALSGLNDPAFWEAAQALGERMAQHESDDRQRLALEFETS